MVLLLVRFVVVLVLGLFVLVHVRQRHAGIDMLLGDRRIGHEVAFRISDAAIETLLAGIDSAVCRILQSKVG